MNAKNSYRIKNHVLSSDSTSSDCEYMYEEVIGRPTPLEASPSPPKKTEKDGLKLRHPSVSDEEIYHGDDCDGDGLYEEGEDGEEEMDYADYGEE